MVNVGCGDDLTIAELAETIRDVVGFEGKLAFDRSKPDGTLQKLLEVSRMCKLEWKARMPLRPGLESVYRDFLTAHHS